MRKLRIFAVLLLWVSSGFAVTNCTRYDSIAQQNKNGVNYVIPNASVQVCPSTATGIPCTPTATVYSDNACSVVIGTATADVNGNFHFYADSSKQYKYQVTGANVALFEVDDLSLPFNPAQPPAISASSYNNVVEADTQVGATADVKLNACIAAVIAAGGGECDARGLKGTQTIAAQVGVGNSSFVPVLLRLPQQGVWTVTITDGVSCGFQQFSGSSMLGTGIGGNSKMIIQAQASTNAASLWCSDPSPSGGGSYVRAEGFLLYDPNGGTLVNGAMDATKLFDNSYFANVSISNYSGIGLNVGRNGLVCCGTSFYNVTSNGNGAAGAQPVKIGASVTDTNFYSLSADHAGAGLNNVLIDDGAIGTTGPVNFYGLYMEGSLAGGGDTTTPFMQINNSRGGVHVWGGWCHAEQAGTAYCIDIANVANQPVSVRGFRAVGATNCNAINDHFANVTVVGTGCGTTNAGFVPDYFSKGAAAAIFNSGVSASQYTSTVATGTAPLVIASTTPVANLTLSQHPQVEYCGATSGGTQACAKTVLTTPFIVQGDVLLNGATTQSITTLPFTNANYSCSGSDLTTAAGIVSFNTYANASVTIQESGGVNTDHLRYICGGN